MGLRIEWRCRAEGDDALLAIEDESNRVVKAWEAEEASLTDFLNDMTGLEATGPEANGHGGVSQDNPEEWGELVIARSEAGDILYIDPPLYWAGIAYWFRSRGNDPHTWRRRR
jgi:hypothetical protein